MLIEIEGGKFCPNCGIELDATDAQQQSVPLAGPVAAPPNCCPNCGLEVSNLQDKYCLRCGGKLVAGAAMILGPVPGQVVQVPPYTPAPLPIQKKMVLGLTIKTIPIASMLTPQETIRGNMTLRRDGVVFAGRGDFILQCHIDDILKVAEGRKSNIMGIKMKTGEEYAFKHMSARKWVRILNEMLASRGPF